MPPTAPPATSYDQTAVNNLDQVAINTTRAQLTTAQDAYSAASKAYDAAVAKGDAPTIAAATNSLDNARTTLGSASTAYADKVEAVANAERAKALSAPSQSEADMWAAQATKDGAQADLAKAEAAIYTAKTQEEIDAAKAHAAAAMQNAVTAAGRAQSTEELQAAQTALTNAKIGNLPALTSSTLALHAQQIATGAAQATLDIARAAQANAAAGLDTARANQIVQLTPAQIDKLEASSDLTHEQATYLRTSGPVKISQIQAATGLTGARMQAILQKLTAPVDITTAGGPGNQFILQQDPATGKITPVPNPNYVNPDAQLQALQHYSETTKYVQSQIASGAMTPDDGTRYMDLLRQNMDATLRGTTPAAMQAAEDAKQQQAASSAQSLLDQRMTAGNSIVDKLVSGAMGAHLTSMPEGFAPVQGALSQMEAFGGTKANADAANQTLAGYFKQRLAMTGNALPPNLRNDPGAQALVANTIGHPGANPAPQPASAPNPPAPANSPGPTAPPDFSGASRWGWTGATAPPNAPLLDRLTAGVLGQH